MKLSFFCVFRILSGHFFTFLPVSKIHTNKDESRAEKEPNGDLLVEQPPGEENAGDGIEVDPVRRDDRTEFADDPVPGEVTEHRGNDSQEEEIEESGKWKEERGGRYSVRNFCVDGFGGYTTAKLLHFSNLQASLSANKHGSRWDRYLGMTAYDSGTCLLPLHPGIRVGSSVKVV